MPRNPLAVAVFIIDIFTGKHVFITAQKRIFALENTECQASFPSLVGRTAFAEIPNGDFHFVFRFTILGDIHPIVGFALGIVRTRTKHGKLAIDLHVIYAVAGNRKLYLPLGGDKFRDKLRIAVLFRLVVVYPNPLFFHHTTSSWRLFEHTARHFILLYHCW